MYKAVISALLASALAGCASTKGCQPFEQQSSGSVSVLSPELAKAIGAQVSTSKTATGMTAVQASVCNCTDADIALIIRTRFSGERGQSEPPSAWRTVHLAPRSTAVYAESAISPASLNVQVDIHNANRGQEQLPPGQRVGQP